MSLHCSLSLPVALGKFCCRKRIVTLQKGPLGRFLSIQGGRRSSKRRRAPFYGVSSTVTEVANIARSIRDFTWNVHLGFQNRSRMGASAFCCRETPTDLASVESDVGPGCTSKSSASFTPDARSGGSLHQIADAPQLYPKFIAGTGR